MHARLQTRAIRYWRDKRGHEGDFVVAAGELALSLVMSILAIVAPILAAAIVCLVAGFVLRPLVPVRPQPAMCAPRGPPPGGDLTFPPPPRTLRNPSF